MLPKAKEIVDAADLKMQEAVEFLEFLQSFLRPERVVVSHAVELPGQRIRQ